MNRASIGDLRHRLTLETPVRTEDGGGGALTVWQAVAEVWAAIVPTGGREAVLAEQVAGSVTHDIVIRHRDAVGPAMRFRRDDRLFAIVAVLDVEERGRRLRCLCREELL